MAVQLSMAQAFSRYDSLGSGGLTSSDIEAFLHAADFDADAAYVAEIMQLWDSDHSGLVEWGEFCELWAHLGLGDTAAFAKDEVAAVFDRFNANGDGMLDMEEVRAMLDAAGYAADSEYVVGLADMFGTYDADGSGGIELSEFREMYEKLGLGPLLAGATGGAAPAVAWPNEVLGGEQRAREVTAVFERFNTNGDGMLDMKEVRAMLEAAGFEADSEYVVGLANMFGTYDRDGSGGIELGEFSTMYEQLGLGERLAAAAAQGPRAAPAAAADVVAAAFDRFNTNGDGMLDLEEVRYMLDAAGFEADSDYVLGIGRMFGKYDRDGSGGIELGEFRQLWAQLGLGERFARAAEWGGEPQHHPVPEEAPPPVAGPGEITAAFDHFNLNGDGMLDNEEIRSMLEAANFSVDSSYVNGLADLFGKYDADGSGGIELQEFHLLWEQLDLGTLLAAAGVTIPQPAALSASAQKRVQFEQPPAAQRQAQRLAHEAQQEQALRAAQREPEPEPEQQLVGAAPLPPGLRPEAQVAEVPVAEAAIRVQSAYRGHRTRAAYRQDQERRAQPSAAAAAGAAGSGQLQQHVLEEALKAAIRSVGPALLQQPPHVAPPRQAPPPSAAAAAAPQTGAGDVVVSARDAKAIMDKVQAVRSRAVVDERRSQALVPLPAARVPSVEVVVQEPGSQYDGKVGRFVSETPSRQFALVQFVGERTPRPIRREACVPTGRSEPAPLALANSRRSSSSSSGSEVVADFEELTEGDSVLIVDPSHSRHGQSAVVSSITPSRQYIVARFDDTGTTRSLHADAVVKQNAW